MEKYCCYPKGRIQNFWIIALILTTHCSKCQEYYHDHHPEIDDRNIAVTSNSDIIYDVENEIVLITERDLESNAVKLEHPHTENIFVAQIADVSALKKLQELENDVGQDKTDLVSDVAFGHSDEISEYTKESKEDIPIAEMEKSEQRKQSGLQGYGTMETETSSEYLPNSNDTEKNCYVEETKFGYVEDAVNHDDNADEKFITKETDTVTSERSDAKSSNSDSNNENMVHSHLENEKSNQNIGEEFEMKSNSQNIEKIFDKTSAYHSTELPFEDLCKDDYNLGGQIESKAKHENDETVEMQSLSDEPVLLEKETFSKEVVVSNLKISSAAHIVNEIPSVLSNETGNKEELGENGLDKISQTEKVPLITSETDSTIREDNFENIKPGIPSKIANVEGYNTDESEENHSFGFKIEKTQDQIQVVVNLDYVVSSPSSSTNMDENPGKKAVTEKLPVKQGSLAEFFKKVSPKMAETKKGKKNQKRIDQNKKVTPKEEVKAVNNGNDNMKLASFHDNGVKETTSMREGNVNRNGEMKPIGFEMHDEISQPYCGIWGTFLTKRKPTDLSVLQLLYADTLLGCVNHTGITYPSPADVAAGILNDTSLKDDVILKFKNSYSKDQTIANGSARTLRKNDFVSGLDDINKLFEGIDPPDELDVGASGSSILEIVIGTTARIVVRRVKILFNFCKKYAVSFRNRITNRLTDKDAFDFEQSSKSRNHEGDGELGIRDRLHNILDHFQDSYGNSKLPGMPEFALAVTYVRSYCAKGFQSSMHFLQAAQSFFGNIFEVDFEEEPLDQEMQKFILQHQKKSVPIR